MPRLNIALRPSSALADAVDGGDKIAGFPTIEGVRDQLISSGEQRQRQAVVLRFGRTVSLRTFSLSHREGRRTLAPFIKNCTFAAAIPTWSDPIPGDLTGTWATDDTVMPCACRFSRGPGPRNNGLKAGGNAGDFISTAAMTNLGVSWRSDSRFGDVGLYLDPNATGVPPPWQMPDEAEELRRVSGTIQVGEA